MQITESNKRVPGTNEEFLMERLRANAEIKSRLKDHISMLMAENVQKLNGTRPYDESDEKYYSGDAFYDNHIRVAISDARFRAYKDCYEKLKELDKELNDGFI